MHPTDSALGIFRSPDPDLCVPRCRILHPEMQDSASPRTLIGPFFFILGVCKRLIARSVLAVSESVLKFQTVKFLANHNSLNFEQQELKLFNFK